MTQKTPKTVADVRARVARETRERESAAALADAFAHLQRLFPSQVWRHEESGAVRIALGSFDNPGSIEWSPSYERNLGPFKATFGRFRARGEYYLTAEQLEALQQYAAVVETAPPPSQNAAVAA